MPCAKPCQRVCVCVYIECQSTGVSVSFTCPKVSNPLCYFHSTISLSCSSSSTMSLHPAAAAVMAQALLGGWGGKGAIVAPFLRWHAGLVPCLPTLSYAAEGSVWTVLYYSCSLLSRAYRWLWEAEYTLVQPENFFSLH